MAKEKPTQAGAIREALQSLGTDASASQVAEFVDGKHKLGIGKKAHLATLVSIERGKIRGGKKRRKKVRRPHAVASRGPLANQLEAAVEFVRAAGGLDAAKQQLEAIERIARLV